jgi:phage protein D/phage baseplate assembly protein gpV
LDTGLTVPNFKISLNGKILSGEIQDAVSQVTVEDEINVPAMFSIRFNTGCYRDDRRIVDLDSFKQGDRVRIFMGMDHAIALIDGEVTALEWGFGDSAFLEVRGYDLLHRLRFGTRDRCFEKRKDSQIFKILAEEAGLGFQGDDSATIRPYIAQTNQSNYQFLQGLAQRIGFEVGVREEKLFFRKRTNQSGADCRLTYGVDLLGFTLRIHTPTAGSRVEVHGFDPKAKKEIAVIAKDNELPGQGNREKKGAALVEAAFGSSTLTIYDENPVDRAEAERIAQAKHDAIFDQMVAGEGHCQGNPQLRAGKKVEIKGIGKQFEGDYRLISTAYTWDKQGYLTFFKVQKGKAAVYNETEQRQQESQSRIYGVMTGIVTSNRDPEKQGRIRVDIPRLGGKFSANWARPAVFMAGIDRGAFFLPEVGDEVLVAFEYGDAALPYIIGSLWNGKDLPPENNSDGKNDQRVLKSRSGHVIRFVDSPGEERLEIADKSGKNRIEFDVKQNKLTIQSDRDLELSARGKLSINARKLELKSSTDVKIAAGTGLELTATGAVKLKGATVDIN